MKPLLFIFLTFLLMYIAADKLLSRQSPSYAIEHPGGIIQQLLDKNSIEPTAKGIIISADRRGHFSGTGMINQHRMRFMIDTGATRVAVPGNLARQAGLTFGRQLMTNTAAGQVQAFQTIIPTLQLGTIIMHNTHALILDKLDQVLIGMSVLKQFKVSQYDGKMSIEQP